MMHAEHSQHEEQILYPFFNSYFPGYCRFVGKVPTERLTIQLRIFSLRSTHGTRTHAPPHTPHATHRTHERRNTPKASTNWRKLPALWRAFFTPTVLAREQAYDSHDTHTTQHVVCGHLLMLFGMRLFVCLMAAGRARLEEDVTDTDRAPDRASGL
jgi:hypothetical protein